MTSYLPGRPFSPDGKGVHEIINEQQCRKINFMVETTREMRGKNPRLCMFLIYSLTSLVNDYLQNFHQVFSTQIQWYCIRMNQSVVSKI